jgi:hypothetical protein
MDSGAAHVIMQTLTLRVVLKKNYNTITAVHEKKVLDAMNEVSWIEVGKISTVDSRDKQFLLAMETLFDKLQKAERELYRLNLTKNESVKVPDHFFEK